MKDNLLMVPFAFIEKAKSSVNIKKNTDILKIYLENCCVALISAKRHCDENTEVALVTNIDVPESFKTLLNKHSVIIYIVPFVHFWFGADYRWSLAYYKLCALKEVVKKYDYKNYCYVDSDVFFQKQLDNIWEECAAHILLFDTTCGLQVASNVRLLNDILSFDKNIEPMPTHWGGEFFAANKEMSVLWINECDKVFTKMKEDNFITRYGDEFILTVAATHMHQYIKNAGAYVFRFWTGSWRYISSSYRNDPVIILHVPAEKNEGMRRLFTIIKKDRFPSNKRVWRILHISRKKPRVILYDLFNGIVSLFKL